MTIGLVLGPYTLYIYVPKRRLPLTRRWGLYDGTCPNLLRIRWSRLLVLGVYKEDYLQILDMCPFDSFCVFCEGWYTSSVTVVRTRNRCVIDFWWRLCVVSWLSFSDGIGAFVKWLGQISSLFSLYLGKNLVKKTNRLILSNIQPSATANKARDYLKWGWGLVQNQQWHHIIKQ